MSTPTDPATLPADVRRKILAARDALLRYDDDAAWHHLYTIADPDLRSQRPWERIEQGDGDRHPPIIVEHTDEGIRFSS